jgi:CheY-like chemotaxis protein
MQMPGMDGMMLARAMEQEPLLARTRRIIMTSLGHRPADAELQEAGIDAYLAKPIRQSRLLDCLTRVMAKADRDAPCGLTTSHNRRISAAIPRPSSPTRRIRILLADDNSINQKVALGQLRRLGHTAEAVASGMEVLDALKAAPYDVVLMDCQMPEMDGYEAARAIRKREAEASAAGTPRPRIYVIAMTANAMEGDREKCLAAGMDDYVSKPVRTDALQAALARWEPALTEPAGEEVPVDMARLREMADDDEAALRELADLYLVQADELMGRLRAAVQAGAAVETERLAHQLGGSSATCGMTGIVAPLRALEEESKTGPSNENASLIREADRQLGRIRAYLASPVPSP